MNNKLQKSRPNIQRLMNESVHASMIGERKNSRFFVENNYHLDLDYEISRNNRYNFLSTILIRGDDYSIRV